MSATVTRTKITFHCTGCADAFEVTDQGVVKLHDEEYGECVWLVGGTLADYVEDPDCSGCGSELVFNTVSVCK
ncbi:hypothetical protein P1P75_01140 [Streptomyces sp. ID05-39B]|jgi:hypothetical protein|uniref:hypothetical protein n=1 Tax=Streptomyces sp. ID05-39B TaxID=3028664 RepID=UPI0029A13E75|nr:hypothetical protein [Streptomyces sp. ID05-39B]MDX3525092.1 hypothetical protein [Streptomyces sp. ID05-39B]